MLTVSLVNYKPDYQIATPELVYLSFKSYYEDNGQHQFQWTFPFTDCDAESAEVLADRILVNDPSVVGFSLYIWNRILSLKVAELVKARSPKTIIVIGGPDQRYDYEPNWWREHSYVDLACDTEAYGEIFWTDLLNQVGRGEFRPEKITWAVYSRAGIVMRTPSSFYKRDYVWPRHIFKRNADYIQHLIAQNKEHRQVNFELSRGCPYGCTYCEWGGGTMSKVTFKPDEYILEDLAWVMDHYNPVEIKVTDANFGIVERDVDFAHAVANYRREPYALVRLESYGIAKTNKRHVGAIYEAFVKHRMVFGGLKFSVQSFEPAALDNIKRPADDWQLMKETVTPILRKYNLNDDMLRFEMIRGLPGDTLTGFYKSFNNTQHIHTERWTWEFLPTSPASAQSYRDEHKIKTVKQHVSLGTAQVDHFHIVGHNEHHAPPTLLEDPRYITSTDIVVETYSYTRQDWAEMYMVHYLVSQGLRSVFMKPLIMYITQHTDLELGQVLKELWHQVYLGGQLSTMQTALAQELGTQLLKKISADECTDIVYTDLSKITSFRVNAHTASVLKMIVQANPVQYFRVLEQWAAQYQDPGLADCVDFLRQSFITLFYDPENPPVITTQHNWYEFLEQEQALEQVECVYHVADTRFWREDGWNNSISWHKYPIQQRMAKHFLPWCSASYDRLIFKDWKRIL